MLTASEILLHASIEKEPALKKLATFREAALAETRDERCTAPARDLLIQAANVAEMLAIMIRG